jgi:hypothetical protein
MAMKLFKSHEQNTFHYLTSVCYKRVPVLSSEKAFEFFIESLSRTRRRNPFKFIGYVVMPPHEPGSVPIEMDWRGYWRSDDFESVVETAGNARL